MIDSDDVVNLNLEFGVPRTDNDDDDDGSNDLPKLTRENGPCA